MTFAINVVDFKTGDSYVHAFGKKSSRARTRRLLTVKDVSHAYKFNTRIEAEKVARRINDAFIDATFELEVVEVSAS